MFPNKYNWIWAAINYNKQIKEWLFPDIAKTIITLLENDWLRGFQVYEKLLKESQYRNIPAFLIYEILNRLVKSQPELMPIVLKNSEEVIIQWQKLNKVTYWITEFTSKYISLLTINKEELEIISIIKLYWEGNYYKIAWYIDIKNTSSVSLIERLESLIKKWIISKSWDIYNISASFLYFLRKLEESTQKNGLVSFFSK